MKRPRVSNTRIKKALHQYETDTEYTLQFNILFVADVLRDLQDCRKHITLLKKQIPKYVVE